MAGTGDPGWITSQQYDGQAVLRGIDNQTIHSDGGWGSGMDTHSWWRFANPAGTRMATQPPSANAYQSEGSPFKWDQWDQVQTACGTVYAGYLSTPHPAVGEPVVRGTVRYAAPWVSLPTETGDPHTWISFLRASWTEWRWTDDGSGIRAIADEIPDYYSSGQPGSNSLDVARPPDSFPFDVCACRRVTLCTRAQT